MKPAHAEVEDKKNLTFTIYYVLTVFHFCGFVGFLTALNVFNNSAIKHTICVCTNVPMYSYLLCNKILCEFVNIAVLL